MDKDEVAKRIMDYLQKHPDAGDTLQGIAKWWLQWERVDESINKIAEALENLINEGLIERQEVRGSNPIYRVYRKL